jgi:hypothetical protein
MSKPLAKQNPHCRLRCSLVTLAVGLIGPLGLTTNQVVRAESSNGSPTAEDDAWTQLRGPNNDGVSAETDLADSWPSTGPPVLWYRRLGKGYSGFVAWDNRIATQYQTLSGQYVICMDADTGETIWHYRYALPFEPAGVYPGPRATPVFANGRLFFADPYATVGCLDSRTGRRLWTVDLDQRYGTRGTGFGYSCSPTVADGRVLLPVGANGASMIALNAGTGATIWKAGSDAASYTPAYPITYRGQPMVLGYLQNALVCHDLETGTLLWRRPLSGGYDEHSAWPIYREPYLWISSPFQSGSQLIELTGDPQLPTRTVWNSQVMSNDILSSVLFRGAIFGFDLREAQAKAHRPSRGQFRCIDFESGEILWSTGSSKMRRNSTRRPEDVGTRIGHASLIIADEKLILLNDTGELILARASREQYHELARANVLSGDICWTQPTLHRGRLFVRNHNVAVCLYLGNPTKLDRTLAANAQTVAEIPQSEYVNWAALILCVEPEYAFDIPSPDWLWQWYMISTAGIIGGSYLLVTTFLLVTRIRLSSSAYRWCCWIIIFLLAVTGTTWISHLVDDFVFTWPLALFVAFQIAVCHSELSRSRRAQAQRWKGRLAVSGFLVVCVTYFLVCRRLSLVFEWAFLCGFPAALPILAVAKNCFRRRTASRLRECLLTAAAFSAFFWSSAAVLWWKFQTG